MRFSLLTLAAFAAAPTFALPRPLVRSDLGILARDSDSGIVARSDSRSNRRHRPGNRQPVPPPRASTWSNPSFSTTGAYKNIFTNGPPPPNAFAGKRPDTQRGPHDPPPMRQSVLDARQQALEFKPNQQHRNPAKTEPGQSPSSSRAPDSSDTPDGTPGTAPPRSQTLPTTSRASSDSPDTPDRPQDAGRRRSQSLPFTSSAPSDSSDSPPGTGLPHARTVPSTSGVSSDLSDAPPIMPIPSPRRGGELRFPSPLRVVTTSTSTPELGELPESSSGVPAAGTSASPVDAPERSLQGNREHTYPPSYHSLEPNRRTRSRSTTPENDRTTGCAGCVIL